MARHLRCGKDTLMARLYTRLRPELNSNTAVLKDNSSHDADSEYEYFLIDKKDLHQSSDDDEDEGSEKEDNLIRVVTFARSQRGGILLVFKSYSYSLQSNKNDIAKWRCTMVQPGTAKRCTAKLFTSKQYEVLDYSAVLIPSGKGKHPLLLYKTHTFAFKVRSSSGVLWHCSRRTRTGCKAFVRTLPDQMDKIISAYEMHCHNPRQVKWAAI
ncbi:unnamed protein product [Arctia plantaginis]|uniref:FLYWCH-type domain-containing protein n=1 Tax=Arctia plantaginis TaxID=874455 RepID=A0A8S0ZRS9_ARCPL|nr:unnamed protein product [Arctia plantaginis]